jgi:hypothetical protein
MKRYLSFSLSVLALCLMAAPAPADDADAVQSQPTTADVVGEWKLMIEAEGQVFEPTVKIAKAGDDLTVEYLSDEFGDHAATEVKLDGNQLSYTIAAESPEGEMKLDFVHKIDGNKLSGEVEYNVGGIQGTADVSGQRDLGSDPVGMWNLVVEAEGQVLEPTLKVSKPDGQLKVELLTNEIGDHEAKDAKLNGNNLVFSFELESAEGSAKLNFNTNIDGDKLTGTVDYELGDISGSTDVDGKREAPAGGAVGSWKLALEAEGQIAEPTLKITEENGALKAEMLTDEIGDHAAKDVKLDGDNLTFVIEIEAPEGAAKAHFKVKIDGDKLTGNVEYELGDISGTTEVTGERE